MLRKSFGVNNMEEKLNEIINKLEDAFRICKDNPETDFEVYLDVDDYALILNKLKAVKT